MGRGKKKSKASGDVDKGNEPSSSQSLSEQVQDMHIGSTSEPTEPTEPMELKQEEEEEIIGLGLGPSKRRPRKKKKNTAAGEQHAGTSAVPTEQMSGLTPAGPSQAFPKLSAGTGALRSPPTPQAQVVPVPSIEQQVHAKAQTRPAWGASQPVSQQQQQSYPVAASSQQQAQVQPPSAWGTSRPQQPQTPQQQHPYPAVASSQQHAPVQAPSAWGTPRPQQQQPYPAAASSQQHAPVQAPSAWGTSRPQQQQPYPAAASSQQHAPVQAPSAWGTPRPQQQQPCPAAASSQQHAPVQAPSAWGTPRPQQQQPYPAAASSQQHAPVQAPSAWGTPRPQQQQPYPAAASSQQHAPVQAPSAYEQQQPQQQPYPAGGSFQPPTKTHPQMTKVPAPDKPSQPGEKGKTAGQLSPGTVSLLQVPAKIPGRTVTHQSRHIKILVNYLEMKIKALKVYRYDVAFKPDRPKKMLSKVFQKIKAQHFPKHIVAFDQHKNCYTLNPLWKTGDERLNASVELLDDNEKKMTYEVTIKATGIVDTGTIKNHMQNAGSSLSPPTEAIQCIDVILQQGTLQNYIRVGRQYFMRPSKPIDLSYGMEMWTGLFQSAIFTSRPFINIDVAHKAIPRHQSLVDALIKDFRMDPNSPLDRQRDLDYFKHFLKGLRVKARLGGGNQVREYICNDIVDPPNRLTFNVNNPDGTTSKITVEKYFQVEKNYRIRYPNLNCLWVGSRDKNIYYPMELLEISYGQAINKQMVDKQLQIMVRESATPPSDRLNKIKEVIRNMNYSRNECFKHFQLDVADKFFQADAKVLPAPRLDIGTGRAIDPRNGVWRANRFLQASALTAWGMIIIDAPQASNRGPDFISMIRQIGSQMSMNVADPLLTNFNVKMTEIRKVLLTASERRINMLFVVVPFRQKDAYDKVKRMAELDVGILTQCIKEQTLQRLSDNTVRNILLKVNSKLMGINQGLETRCLPECIKNGNVMMVGADVTHPSPDQKSIPSIAAVTASIDPKCFIYNIELSIQTPKEEIIVDFENMIHDHLVQYRQRQNALPRKIYVFRDGVSDGQFSHVMKYELTAIKKAYYRLDQRVKPEILFLLVQKRHHTRFFLGENNAQNVEPGTVVDKDIVHPRELDFYLVSHQAIKGTARPTRYHCVCNDGNIPSDEVEQLAYYLCHLYSRCTRAVSYPAPTYYAHLACLRARALTSGDRFDNTELEVRPKRLRVLDRMLQYSRMFYV